MAEKRNNFVTLVRNKAVKWPTERGFDEHLWLRAWDESSRNESADHELYEAGIIFNQILRELRKEISDIYGNPPNIPPTELLKAYCGIANRDRAIIGKPNASKGFDISAFRTTNNAVGNEITLQEVADGCVDAIETAIRATIQRSPQANGNYNGADAFEFMQKEVAISQLYGTYEDYWRALVWGDYRFSKISDKYNAYEIQQAASEFNIAYESSQIRRNKLLAHTIPFISEDFVLKIFGDKPCLSWVRIGKKKTLAVKSVKDLRDIYQIAYASFAYQTTFLYDNFPNEFLNTDHGGQGFTILELVEIFKLLVIISLISLDQFPQDDSVYSFNKATRFCPTISRDELLRGIRQATGFDFDKCTKMLEFLTFNGDRGKDLWCFPIVKPRKKPNHVFGCLIGLAIATTSSRALAR